MNKSRCMACHTPHEDAKEPHYFPKGRPWVCDHCRMSREYDDYKTKRQWDYVYSQLSAPDLVNEPPHYKGLVVRVDPMRTVTEQDGDRVEVGIESIELIEGFGFGFNLGNVVKYLYRSNEKGDRLENLRKAAWYLNREVDNG